MTDRRVDLALTTGLNDGTSWANAYQGIAGWVTAEAASAGGDNVYTQGDKTEVTTRILSGPTTLASAINPVKNIGVRTDASDTILKTDIILGHREGNATKAYLQSGAEEPPNAIMSSSADSTVNGNLYMYAGKWEVQDNFSIGNLATMSVQTWEEYELKTGLISGDKLIIGTTNSSISTHRFTFINCLFTLGASDFTFKGYAFADFYNCEFTGTKVGTINGDLFTGTGRFFDCDFTGCDATLVDRAGFHDATVEFHNCRMPASHILSTGTATGFYTVINYGSEDSTGLTTGGSEQALEIHTHQGTVDIETTVVRTGGATDLADGLFVYAIVANNVTENFVGVEVPLRDIWVEGDGTAKTYTVHIANSLAESSPTNDLHDSEGYLRIESPSGAGLSMYDYLPDEGAPGDGGGLMQLLGTPADLANHAGTTWAVNGNNEQEISNSIAPDYEGVIHGTLILSSERGSLIVYADPLPVVT